MAYEGFQLLAYDYDDIAAPGVTLPRAVLSAIVVVAAIYVAVTLGIPMLIGADSVMAHKEVALAVAGERAWGTTGLVVATVAAAFSTGSAINSTLFATARLSREVARQGQLPSLVDHENHAGVPDRAGGTSEVPSPFDGTCVILTVRGRCTRKWRTEAIGIATASMMA